MKIGLGAIIGVIGGLLAVVGVFLPWLSISIPGVITIEASGFQLGSLATSVPGAGAWAIFPYGVLAFGILGLIFCLIPKKITAILAFVFGLLAMILAAIGMASISGATLGLGVGYGVYVSILGGLLLLVGGLLAFMSLRKGAAMAPPMPAPPPGA